MKREIVVRFARNEDRDAIADFRISQYKSARQFELIDESLLRQQSGNIYLIEHEGNIVSTVQANICLNFEQLDDQTTAILDTNLDIFPCMNITKVATEQSFRNTGLNSYLRLQFIKKAREDNIKAISGTSYENSPRLNLLKELGYKFCSVGEKQQNYIKPKGKVFFFYLDSSFFESAIKILEVRTKPIHDQFDIIYQV